MTPNLKWKGLFILAVILLSIYGLIGLPNFPTSVARMKEPATDQARPGLAGRHPSGAAGTSAGSHRTETDQTVDRLIKQMRDRVSLHRNHRVGNTHILVPM
jgi:hypothetical protein